MRGTWAGAPWSVGCCSIRAGFRAGGFSLSLSSPRPPPLTRFVDPQPGPDLAARIQDGDLITNRPFYSTIVCLVAWPLNESEAGVDLTHEESARVVLCK